MERRRSSDLLGAPVGRLSPWWRASSPPWRPDHCSATRGVERRRSSEPSALPLVAKHPGGERLNARSWRPQRVRVRSVAADDLCGGLTTVNCYVMLWLPLPLGAKRTLHVCPRTLRATLRRDVVRARLRAARRLEAETIWRARPRAGFVLERSDSSELRPRRGCARRSGHFVLAPK